jgi:TPR repeat protein
MKHDKHYASKEIEPIQVIEETIDRLTGKLDPKAVFNIGQSLKYILRAGLKEGESVEKDLDKAYNYLHRAKRGTWV